MLQIHYNRGMQGVFSLIFDIFRILFLRFSPGGKSNLLAELVLLRRQLILVSRTRCKVPKMTVFDRFVLAAASLFISSSRLRGTLKHGPELFVSAMSFLFDGAHGGTGSLAQPPPGSSPRPLASGSLPAGWAEVDGRVAKDRYPGYRDSQSRGR